MTVNGPPAFSDGDLRRYLAARADVVASRAAPGEDMAFRVAAQLGLVRRRRTGAARTLRLVVIAAVLAALVAGALYLIGRLRDDYVPTQPQVTVELHGSPWAVAPLGGSIWAAGYIEPILFEIDPATGDRAARDPDRQADLR